MGPDSPSGGEKELQRLLLDDFSVSLKLGQKRGKSPQGEREMRYRDYVIEWNPKPIPTRKHDWDFVHDDYDGPGDRRCGTAASIVAAKVEIDNLEDE